SLLAGIPIPYGNIGSIIPELIETSGTGNNIDTYKRLVEAVRLNTYQIWRYLQSMEGDFGFSSKIMKELKTALDKCEAKLSLVTENIEQLKYLFEEHMR